MPTKPNALKPPSPGVVVKKPKVPKTPAADKSPDKVTKAEAAFAKRFAKITQLARTKVDIKGGTTTRAQAKAIKEARAKLVEMKKTAVQKGYGSRTPGRNKKGGITTRGVYKDLTGKPMPKKKPRPTKKPKPGTMPPPP